jgi:hypothetical protein
MCCILEPERYLEDVVSIVLFFINNNTHSTGVHIPQTIFVDKHRFSTYITCIRSNQHIMVREDGKVHLETTFVSSLFKCLSNRDTAAVEEHKFLIKRSK